MILIHCHQCGKWFFGYPSRVKKGRVNFCSPKCKGLARRKHSTVEFMGNIYYLSTRYYICSETRRWLHRDVWEHHNGPIPDGFVVHHVDKNTTNNDIDNLQIMERGEHISFHNKEKRRFPIQPRTFCKCGSPCVGRGLCNNHYHKLRRSLLKNGTWIPGQYQLQKQSTIN